MTNAEYYNDKLVREMLAAYDAYIKRDDALLTLTSWLDAEYRKPDKAKFVRINLQKHSGKYHFAWAEWFCLDETWTHPYNRKDEKAEKFRAWCKDLEYMWDNGCCPDVTIKGDTLHDGWGSDICNRICLDYERDGKVAGEFADVIERALHTGEAQGFAVTNEKGERLDAVMTPYNSITPDKDSINKFGPFADDALTGLDN